MLSEAASLGGEIADMNRLIDVNCGQEVAGIQLIYIVTREIHCKAAVDCST